MSKKTLIKSSDIALTSLLPYKCVTSKLRMKTRSAVIFQQTQIKLSSPNHFITPNCDFFFNVCKLTLFSFY